MLKVIEFNGKTYKLQDYEELKMTPDIKGWKDHKLHMDGHNYANRTYVSEQVRCMMIDNIIEGRRNDIIVGDLVTVRDMHTYHNPTVLKPNSTIGRVVKLGINGFNIEVLYNDYSARVQKPGEIICAIISEFAKIVERVN